ncbi:MAG: PqqD family protein [Clostridia bacterium]|nr:PqqD family protein [Clostridia bacterium]
MKIKNDFVLKTIAGTNVVVPLGSNTVSFRAIITLNESGAFLWQSLENDITKEQLLQLMLKEYDIDRETALSDIEEFLNKLREAELLDEN